MTTFVLVHGGHHTGQCWERLRPLLNGNVRAVDLPGRGAHPQNLRDVRLSGWIDAVAHEVEKASDTDVVLVGHSLAGVVLPAVAARAPDRISRLVLIAAVLPRHGQTQRKNMPWAGRLAMRIQERDGVLRRPPRWLIRWMFCNDMDPATRDWTIHSVVPEAAAVFDEPIFRVPLPDVPTTYIRMRRDHAVTPRMARRQVAAYDSALEIVELDAGHDVMISHPEELATVLNSYTSTRTRL